MLNPPDGDCKAQLYRPQYNIELIGPLLDLRFQGQVKQPVHRLKRFEVSA